MIDIPDKAGVVYSEGFECQPYIPISYTKNKLADKLVMNEESGNSFIMMKASVKTPDGDAVRFYNHDYKNYHYDNGVKLLSEQQCIENRDLLNLARFANATEQFFGHAVDIEFAIRGNTTYILQQRPYIMPTFKTKQFNECCISVYNPKQPIIKGVVQILDNKDDKRESDVVILKHDGFIEIQKNYYKNIANSFAQQESAYHHYGNQKRESIDRSCFMTVETPVFPNDIRTGDYIELDLLSGTLKIWPISKER